MSSINNVSIFHFLDTHFSKSKQVLMKKSSCSKWYPTRVSCFMQKYVKEDGYFLIQVGFKQCSEIMELSASSKTQHLNGTILTVNNA